MSLSNSQTPLLSRTQPSPPKTRYSQTLPLSRLFSHSQDQFLPLTFLGFAETTEAVPHFCVSHSQSFLGGLAVVQMGACFFMIANRAQTIANC